MNAVAVMYVNAHLEELRAEAQQKRLAQLAPKRSLRERLAAASASLTGSLRADEIGRDVPTLSHWPYRV